MFGDFVVVEVVCIGDFYCVRFKVYVGVFIGDYWD